MNRDIETYYRRRATEYDDVYRKPERQADIQALGSKLAALVAHRRVLEVAASTGFWSARVAPAVESLLATDVADETLELARRRDYGEAAVDFLVADAFALNAVPGAFNAGMACFWLSHLTRARMLPFVRHFVDRLEPGSRVVLADNRYVDGSNHLITRTDPAGNTYQRRTLRDGGEEYEVIKNFPTREELLQIASAMGSVGSVELLEYYWLLTFETPQ